MLTGNKGEWSEPYALLKLLADRKLFLGGENFTKINDSFYPIINITRSEKNNIVEFTYYDDFICVLEGESLFKIPINEFVKNAKLCFDKIKDSEVGKGSFDIPEIEEFLESFSIYTLKAKSKLKNDLTIQIEDPNTFLKPLLGFSIKSQLGRPSTLVNASSATNFTYKLKGAQLIQHEIDTINKTRVFSDKFKLLKKLGVNLEYETVDNNVFKSNLQTIDFNFDKILSEILVLYYINDVASENTVANFINKITNKNSIGYDLKINSSMYELIMKKFLTDYALGMRAAEVWKREIQATGGYIIVKEDGEIICYHFYFAKNFEDYLFNNTKLDTPDPERHKFGSIYSENGQNKIKLNLQIRFIK